MDIFCTVLGTFQPLWCLSDNGSGDGAFKVSVERNLHVGVLHKLQD